MSSFTDPLVVQKLPNGRWKTTRQFTYYVGEEHSHDRITVPKNFSTDFASVPRIFWVLLPPAGS